jgi:DnaJ-class molecular chaperone
MNYYNILGLNNNASESDIKTSYRKLSLKYHPDKNINNTEFDKNKIIEIQKAYELLSDPDKKKEYDLLLQKEHTNNFEIKQEFDINNIFKMFYENGPQMANNIFKNINKPIPIILNLNISLQQSYNGTLIPVEITRWLLINDNQINETEVIYIPVPKGIDTGEILILKERGNVINENNKGDIKIIFKIINNTEFIRNGLDLYYKKTITLKESLCGFNFEIIHINEKTTLKYNTINNNIDDNTEINIIYNGYKHIIPKYGMIRDDNIGNLIIDFNVIFPDKITNSQRNKLNEIL